ncbi:MAG: hypothetical protein ACM3VW_00375 [Bacteroidota bacterium]
MSRIVLEILAIILIVYFSSGVWWGIGRRPRTLTEKHYRKAEQWRLEREGCPPDEDALLCALDIALRDEQESSSTGGAEKRLSPEEQKT